MHKNTVSITNPVSISLDRISERVVVIINSVIDSGTVHMTCLYASSMSVLQIILICTINHTNIATTATTTIPPTSI